VCKGTKNICNFAAKSKNYGKESFRTEETAGGGGKGTAT
jgi:hypothetical protein